ncbi:hypothetical protein [Nocardia camponoti]|uniref:DUF8020 domain-containing protein n=1 Tax=Nocardia camponoti TaxID=1616106 RepID=A0A917QMH2_9NOCA|nr:hypothetical protein [Nocardia camponoti]GGK58444.1 hypothetical protein GCM10011591_33300 [Nocardia camponoti]
MALPIVVAVGLVGAGNASANDDQAVRYAAGLGSAGTAEGVGYRTEVAPDLKTVSASVDSGRFVASPEGGIVLESPTGAAITTIPASFATAGGNTITFATAIAEGGRGITITPQVAKPAADELRTIATVPGSQDSDPIHNGAAAGAGVGAIVGAVLCLPALAAFIIGYLPCAAIGVLTNALFGALIGAVVGAVAPDVIPQVLP